VLKCFKKLNWKKIIISTVLGGIALFVLSFVFTAIWSALFPQYNIFSIGGMRSVDDPVLAWFYAYPFVLAFFFNIAYSILHTAVKEDTLFKQGLAFGITVWVLFSLSGLFLIWSSMDYGETFLLTKFTGDLVYFAVLGIIAAWTFREFK